MKMRTLILPAIAAVAFLIFLMTHSNNTKQNIGITNTSNRDFPQERLDWEFQLLKDPATNKIPKDIRTKEVKFSESIPTVESFGKNTNNKFNKTSDIGTWQSIGPENIGGRTRAIAYDKSDAANNTILAGGITGGLWRSTNAGADWVRQTSLTQLASVTTLVQDQRTGKTNIWYYGTGENKGNSASSSGDNSEFLGNGIFKSVDNGLTWNLLNSTANNRVINPGPFNYVWRLATNNANNLQDEIYAALVGGIMKSFDGGSNWQTVLGDSATGRYTDIIITTTGILYAVISSDANTDNGIWRSTTGNRGDWTDITPGSWPANFDRIVLAAAGSNENIIYFFAETPGTGTGRSIWKYTYLSGDGSGAGGTWEDRSASLPNDFNTQGSYDQLIAVKPDNPEVVFIGGVDLLRSSNGFADNSTNTIVGGTGSGPLGDYPNHFPDQHMLVFSPANPQVMLSSNDGGVFRTDDNTAGTVTWTELNNKYRTTQYYGIAIDYASSSKIVTGGMQDRGNFFVNPSIGTNGIPMDDGGLDGTLHGISSNRSFYYFGSQSGGLFRANFTDAGIKSNGDEITPQNATGQLFVNPFMLNPGNTEIIFYAGGQSLLRTNSASTVTTADWTLLNNSTVNGAVISAIGVSKTNNANVVYYGTDIGQIFRLDNADSGDPAPVDIWTGKGLPVNGYINCIAVDKANSNNAIAVFSNYNILSLFYTFDGGNTWTSIGGNLEENQDGTGNGPSTRWASILNFNGQTIYLTATSTGVYSTTNLNGMNTQWAREGNTTIGNVVCAMVLSRESDGYVAVGTHGNGAYTATISTTGIDNLSGEIPSSFNLSQNYPNPFNPSTKIQFSIPKASKVEITVYDVLGSFVEELVNEQFSAGNFSVDFNGQGLASGIYYYTMKAGNFFHSNKMVLIK